MSNPSNTSNLAQTHPLIAQLATAFDAVGELIAQVKSVQWSAPTPCADWTVRRLVDHLIGMNQVFAALLSGQRPPERRPADHGEADPVGAYHDTARTLVSAFAAPGILDREFQGPMGSATGAQRLQVRLYDLIAHGWDLAHATGAHLDLPDEMAEQSLAFARHQVADPARPGRFAPAQAVDEHAPAIDRLAAFLGRPVDAARPAIRPPQGG